MNSHTTIIEAPPPVLAKLDVMTPALKVIDRAAIVIKAGTIFAGHTFTEDTPVPLHLGADGQPGYIAGGDYSVIVCDGAVSVTKLIDAPDRDNTYVLGGFHFAPGGNAVGRAGGDDVPAINPHSLWDVNFRPACADPRGMTLVDASGHRFWCDIYLCAAADLGNGTSKYEVIIADGNDRPLDTKGAPFRRFDYETAVAVMARHGKGLLSIEEFFAAAYGVTEKTSHDGDPETTGLDAPRTSKWGVMQATGNMWVWGHDGDPDTPRASIFGGSWWDDADAGSRYANLDHWPDNSHENIGARGRSDHLQLG